MKSDKYLRPAGDTQIQKVWEELGKNFSRKKYNKLVGHKVISDLKRKGLDPKFHVADNEEYWTKLKEKLEEEVREFLAAENPKQQHEEFVDIQEVLDEMFEYPGIKKEYIEHLQKEKAKKKGRFKKRIILEEV